MIRKFWHVSLAVVLAAVASGIVAGGSTAQATDVQPQNDLFYNYYVAPSRQGGIGAQLYPSPIPVPAHVGQTYITYQPLMPHEFMYPHSRVYRRYDRPMGIIPRNVTRVRWW
jgi:hypothetical protein